MILACTECYAIIPVMCARRPPRARRPGASAAPRAGEQCPRGRGGARRRRWRVRWRWPDGGGGSGANGGGGACNDDVALRLGDHADVAWLLALMKNTRAEKVRARARRWLRTPPRRRGSQRARAVSRAAARRRATRRRATRRRRNLPVQAYPGGRAVGAADPDRGRAHRRRCLATSACGLGHLILTCPILMLKYTQIRGSLFRLYMIKAL
jgi:hypothetical protein